jgi:7-cyano-7-deazaguanine synthase
MTSYLVCLSGGLDSITLAAKLLRERRAVTGVFFRWGQTNVEREERALAYFEAKLPIQVYRASFEDWRETIAAQGINVPALHLPRNALFVLAALPYAWEVRADFIALGSNVDDTKVSDGSRAFVEAINNLLEVTEQPSRLRAPFLDDGLDKVGVLRLAKQVLGAEDVERTWTCWAAEELPCGQCAACRSRRAAEERLALTSSRRTEADSESPDRP